MEAQAAGPSVTSCLNRNTLRFAILYALALSVAGVDLSITVRSAQNLTHSAVGGTSAYSFIGLGMILGARFGMKVICSLGPRATFRIAGVLCLASGLTTAASAHGSSIATFYCGLLLVGVFMGVSNYHRILVQDHSSVRSPWNTSLVLLSGVVGAVCSPFISSLISQNDAGLWKSYILVAIVGVAYSGFATLLPRRGAGDQAAQPARSDRHVPTDLRKDLYIAGGIGFASYLAMTLIMSSVPVEAERIGASDQAISTLAQVHLVSMYLPILFASLSLSRHSSRLVAGRAYVVVLILLSALAVILQRGQLIHLCLFALMVVGGVLWAYTYTAASSMIASNEYGRLNPAHRGRVEVLPPLGMITGAVLAGFCIQGWGIVSVVVVSAAVCLLGAATSYSILTPGRRTHDAARSE
jgi:hypothetical protein